MISTHKEVDNACLNLLIECSAEHNIFFAFDPGPLQTVHATGQDASASLVSALLNARMVLKNPTQRSIDDIGSCSYSKMTHDI